MKWQQDLIKDIRRNNGTDGRDLPDRCYSEPGWPHGNDWKTNSDENKRILEEKFLSIRDRCLSILEIGISREGPDSFTNIFIRNKLPNAIYIGIDIGDKTYLDNRDNHVYTIRASSSDYEYCKNIINTFFGIQQFDFIFIDGWHSVNQVLQDWEYTNMLTPNGMVGFHDTQWHPGPKLFMEALDTDKWNVIPNAVVDNEQDWGIGFVWPKN